MRQAIKRGVEVGFYLGVVWGMWTAFQLLAKLAPTRCLAESLDAFFLASLATFFFAAGLFLPLCLSMAVVVWIGGKLILKRDTDPLAACVAAGIAVLAFVSFLSFLNIGTPNLRQSIPLAGVALATLLLAAGAAGLVHLAFRSERRGTIFAAFAGLLFSLFATFPATAWGIAKVLGASGVSRMDRLGFMAAVGGGIAVVWALLWLAIRFRPWVKTVLAVLVAVGCSVGTAGMYARGMGLGGLPQPTGAADRPNVLFVVIDSLRADIIGAYGGTARTPNLDRLAAESVVFDNDISVAPWTFPSMVSLFTSLYPSVHGAGVRSIRLDDGLTTLAERFQKSDYCTSAVLQQHLFLQPTGFDRGLDGIYSVECWLPSVVAETDTGKWLSNLYGLDSFGIEGTERVGDATIRTLSNTGAPFFMWVHWYDPHNPYAPPAPFEPPQSKVELFQGARGWSRLSKVDTMDLSRYFFDSQELIDVVGAMYRAEIEFVDREVGRMLDALDASGLADNTILVLTSDHGEELWEHQDWDHGQSLHRELLRVPLMFRIPETAPSRIPTRVRSIDIYPTLLELSGIDYDPETIQGVSMVPVIRGEEVADRDLIAESCLYYQEQKALYEGDYKAIWYTFRLDPLLYDLTADPLETRNLAPEMPERLSAMRQVFDRRFSANLNLRKRLLGADAEETTPVSPETIEQLKALGYVND